MKLKAGIYVDGENIMRSGGWGMRYDILKEFVIAQGGIVLRANAYMAMDGDREKADPEYAQSKIDYRSNLRRYGFKLILKPLQRYKDKYGEMITKANADLELAIDALLQARNLDYLVLVTGDGDFVRLVTALQNRGCRVDVLAFHNASFKLRQAADNFVSGFLLPGLLPAKNDRLRGFLHTVDEEKYFGFITVQTSLHLHEIEQDIFCHGRDVEGGTLSNREFSRLKGNNRVLEFTAVEDEKGRRRAANVTVLRPGLDDRMPRPKSRDPQKPEAGAEGDRPGTPEPEPEKANDKGHGKENGEENGEENGDD
jgi:uncharacterized LabA/DUF88 family protein/cold shock CspA family protein